MDDFNRVVIDEDTIRLGQRIGRAFYMSGVAGRMQHCAGQRGLAGAKVSLQIDRQAGRKCACQGRAERCSAGFVMELGLQMPHCVKWSLYIAGKRYPDLRAYVMTVRNDNLPALALAIKAWGRELGFADIGIADTELQHAEAGLQAWLDAGHHGDMDYMAAHGMKRARPAELVPGTVRVITARMDYLPRDAAADWRTREECRVSDPQQAVVSVYARGRDYHKVLRSRLQQLADRIQAEVGEFGYRVFTDSAPVMEVALAEKSGIGWRGKHTLLLNRDAGSMFFLGELYTDLPLPVDTPASSHCGQCSACIDICPTQAILGPYKLDAQRCISYLTIELKGSIPVELRPLIGNRVYGCDDCQVVCPWNKFAQRATLSDFDVRNGLDSIALVDLFAWEEDDFNRRLEGSPIRRIGHERWLRNIAVGLGNAARQQRHSPQIIAALRARSGHPSSLVREHVAWALEQHGEL
jgi:epoxyqueuosine reductase